MVYYIVISCDHEYVILVLLFTAHCSSILYWPIGDFPGVVQASFVKVNNDTVSLLVQVSYHWFFKNGWHSWQQALF